MLQQQKNAGCCVEPGVLNAVFNVLQLKVQQWKSQECECCLTLDEMAITPSVEFDQSSGRLLGGVTLPSHSGSAIHGLVFMLGGITTRWKQIVGYHCTGNSVDGTALKAMALYIIYIWRYVNGSQNT